MGGGRLREVVAQGGSTVLSQPLVVLSQVNSAKKTEVDANCRARYKVCENCHSLSTKPQLFPEADNKQLMSTAATVHWKPLFCIVLYLDDAFGLVVVGDQDLGLDFDDGEDSGKFLYRRRYRSQGIVTYLHCQTTKLYGNPKST